MLEESAMLEERSACPTTMHVRPTNVCPTNKYMSDQYLHEWSVGEVDQLARGGLSQDSQKQLQQDMRESLILPTNGGFVTFRILNIYL